jgi:hypothetical protein
MKRSLAGDKLNPALKSFIDNAIVPILVREWLEQMRKKPTDPKIAETPATDSAGKMERPPGRTIGKKAENCGRGIRGNECKDRIGLSELLMTILRRMVSGLFAEVLCAVRVRGQGDENEPL